MGRLRLGLLIRVAAHYNVGVRFRVMVGMAKVSKVRDRRRRRIYFPQTQY